MKKLTPEDLKNCIWQETSNGDDYVPIDPNVEMHFKICKELNGIYSRKNHDYGDSFHKTFQEEGMVMARIRLSDKLERFKSLTKNSVVQKVGDESIEGTLMDLANYAIMTVIEMRRPHSPEFSKKEFVNFRKEILESCND